MNYELSTINHLSPLEVFLRIPEDAQHLSCLFSDGSEDSRWSILAWDPVMTVKGNGRWSMVNGQRFQQSIGIVLHEKLKKRNQTFTNKFPFLGGAIGAVDYEYGYELLGIPYESPRDSLVEFSFYDQAIIFDHHQRQWWGVNMNGEDVAFCGNAPRRVHTDRHPLPDVEPSWNFQEYQKFFDFIHDNIRKGEIYQACLTFPFFGEPVQDPRLSFYELASQRSAPMAAYLEQSERTIMSLSPERFISWDGKNLETKPIKGTRSRGKTPEEDERLKQELLADKKEQAELCMITDLLRNDMAKVSKPGTVQVMEHQALQQCPNVWHTSSHIHSQTKEGIAAWDILESLFPGGSISGCPKKRAVELLAEAEPHPRGIYTGCIGYISDHGTMDMNIAIRTLEQTKDQLQASFGGGIVYDSEAKKEYEECFAKSTVVRSGASSIR